MPRVLVIADHGRVTHDERVWASDFESEHFRRCLAERLSWATEDADRPPREADESHHVEVALAA